MCIIKVKELGTQELTQTLCEYLHNIDIQYFSIPWTINNWINLINTYNNNYKIYLIYSNKQIIGFSLLKLSLYENLAHLLKIIIIESHQGKNLGNTLLSNSLEMLSAEGYSKIYLEVETTNRPAISLYYKLDFSRSHEINNFYSDGCDALVMTNYASHSYLS